MAQRYLVECDKSSLKRIFRLLLSFGNATVPGKYLYSECRLAFSNCRPAFRRRNPLQEHFHEKIVLSLMAAAVVPALARSPYYNDKLRQYEFTSPSRSVRCQGGRAAADGEPAFNGAQCSAFASDKDWKALPELPCPEDCDLDAMTIHTVGSEGKAERYAACTGDMYYNPEESVPALPCGETVRGEGWQCTSSRQGMRCENDDGHGFMLNRQQQTLF